MNKVFKLFFLLLISFLNLFFFSASFASSNVLFILDASNSMWGRVDGIPKIETAKRVLVSLLRDLPTDTNIGIMAYGHRSEQDCRDVELLVPIGPNNPDLLAKRIQTIQPRGKTPLTYSLNQSLPLFASLKGQNNNVILVSDGIETCGGDPCQAAKKLSTAGVGLKVHVVSFDVSDEERKQLECIAKEGKGRYFNAKNTEGFKIAFSQVKKEVSSSKPAPKNKVYFFDDFDGNELKEDWEVVNPNLDNFIVEDGYLTVISSKVGHLWDEKNKVENMFRLTKPMPKGDWIISAKFIVDLQTEKERPFLALYQDKDNYIGIFGYGYKDVGWDDGKYFIEVVKRLKGKPVHFSKRMYSSYPITKLKYSDLMKSMPQPIIFRIKKVGRSYYASAMLAGAKNPKWVELEKVTALRAKGNLVFGIYQDKRTEGETTINFDWVKIETIK